MKRLLITAMICAAATGVFAKDRSDTTKTKADTAKKDIIKIGVGEGSEYRINTYGDAALRIRRYTSDSTKRSTYPKGFMGITFSRFDLGYAVLTDHGSFTLAPQNQFLDYNQWKTSEVGFDVFQMGVKLNKNFKMYLSAGFDWTLIRLRNNITIVPGAPVLTWKPDSVHLHKDRLSASYLRVPLSFDFHSDKNDKGDRFNFVFGPEAGLLMNGMLKQVSVADGKQKFDAGYNIAKVRYGAFMRVGYGGWGVFAKYYFNDMFENSPEQAGIKTFSFGLTFGF